MVAAEASSYGETEVAAEASSYSGAAAHMDDDPVHGSFLLDRLEWQDRDAGGTVHWKTRAWIGRDFSRIWLRTEGERTRGQAGGQELELLWGRPVAAWWDLVLGVRHDPGAGSSRSYAVAGVQGIAPWGFDVETTALFGEAGQAGVKVDVEYELLLTNRLVLVPEIEIEAWRRDDADAGIGSGVGKLGGGLRLRYEIRREFAPYIGLEWEGHVGDTADLVREDGEPVRDTRFVAGFRLWF